MATSTIDEALELGVEEFSFTGGEPFVNPHFMDIMDCALEHRPCFVLTNGTEPLLNRMAKIITLKEKPNPLAFRVSLDHPDPVKHDESRGKGNFRMALRTLKMGYVWAMLPSALTVPQPWKVLQHPKGYSVPSR